MAYPKSAGARVALGALCALWLAGASSAGCASGGGGTDDAGHGGTPDTGQHDSAVDAARGDTGPMPDTGPPRDTGPRDSGAPDTGPNCGTMVCTGFTHCVSGTCAAYPMCRGDGTCPTPGDVCIASRCVPGTVDIDGDGSPAAMDCDETDPTRSPLQPEICNNRDDNCNTTIDDGDPAALCASDPAHGVCTAGVCGCPAGSADVDLSMPGCECTLHPLESEGMSCASPIDLGTVFDEAASGTQTISVMGNALDNVGGAREVWYHFHATDIGDTTCDHFNVHVAFATNPGNTYEFLVLRGSCGAMAECSDCTGSTCENFADFRFATDALSGMVGQCPCGTSPSTTQNLCSDDSNDFYVRVRRHAGLPATCAQYALSITNGMP